MHILAFTSRGDDVRRREGGFFRKERKAEIFIFLSVAPFHLRCRVTHAQRMSTTLMQLIFDESIFN